MSPRAASVTAALVVALVGAPLVQAETSSQVRTLAERAAGGDAAALAQLVLDWMIVARADAKETRRRASEDDPGHYAVFLTSVVASVISLFAAAVVLRKVRALPEAESTVGTALTLAAVALSWVLTHTAYTFRYAHLHYRDSGSRGTRSDGLQFCGPQEPSDIDFAYFAFTIGMCFQVSDVVVLSTGIRREVLLHAVLSFAYNTTILALALNLVATVIS